MNTLSFFTAGIAALALSCLACRGQEVPALPPSSTTEPTTFAPPAGPPLQTRVFEVRADFFRYAADPNHQSGPADPFATDEEESKIPANIDFKTALCQLGIEFSAPGSKVTKGPGRWEITMTNTPEQLANTDAVLTPMGVGPPRQGQAHLEVFSMPPLMARKALMAHPRESELYAWLDSELKKADSSVKMERHTITIVRGGQRSKTEGIAEIPRPTKYLPGTIPQSIIPQGFKSHNAGDIFEVEMSFGDDSRSVDLNMAPETTRRTGVVRTGPHQKIQQPIFETQKIFTQASNLLGQPMLISTFSPPVNTGVPGSNTVERTWLLFVTVIEQE